MPPIDVVKDIRRSEFDLLRGIAILSVVFFHSIDHFLDYSPLLLLIHRICDQFQLPVFLFVSGYFFHISVKQECSPKILLLKKVKRLMLPYVVFGTLCFVFKALYLSGKGLYVTEIRDYMSSIATMSVSFKVINSVGLGVGPAWFLMMLFVLMVISYGLSRVHVVFSAALVLSLSCLFFHIPERPTLSIAMVSYYLIPFQIGHLFHHMENYVKVLPSKYKYLVISGSALSIIMINALSICRTIQGNNVLLTFLWITFLYVLTSTLRHRAGLLEYLGKKSMLIFLLHAPYFILFGLYIGSAFNMSYVSQIVLLCVLCVLGPLLIGRIYYEVVSMALEAMRLSGKHRCCQSVNS